ncbi:hypothetical protein GCM10025779_02000 [Arthrobacter cryoconiti]
MTEVYDCALKWASNVNRVDTFVLMPLHAARLLPAIMPVPRIFCALALGTTVCALALVPALSSARPPGP